MTEIDWTEAQLQLSFQALLTLNFVNFAIFPLAMAAYKSRTGFLNTSDTIFWSIGTIWETTIYGAFLYLGMFVSPEYATSLAWIPLLLTSVIIWPLCYVDYDA